MIPHVIHYCWFGRGEKPKLALKCIESWRKFFPDYEIKEWNEDNFDVNIIPYTAQAYERRKYAFVSDYARFWILYHHGGLYFDTDVEVIRSMDDIVAQGPFMGIEVNSTRDDETPAVAPGLGLGAEPGMSIYNAVLDHYATQHFVDSNGKQNEGTVVSHNTQVLAANGLRATNELQQVAGVWIYPQDYFNPYRYTVDRLEITERTRSIHWYGASWISPWGRLRLRLGTFVRKHILHHS